MKSDSASKIALVTGAGRGIGRAIARQLVQAGVTVYVNDINAEAVRDVVHELIAAEGKAFPAAADIANAAEVTALFAIIAARTGRLDMLVNNAAISHPAALSEISDDDWQAVLSVNLSGAFYCCRAAFPLMQTHGGRIINLSSVSAYTGKVLSNNAAYIAAKAGLDGLTRALSREGAPLGIAVNSVAPGIVETDIHAHLSAEQRALLPSLIPTDRLATAEEVAEVVCFLATAASSQLTGQIIHVNGGMYFA
ncbi:MAG: SDR family oxidoreductase [Acidobacteria bacterium]|nr:SDR family oxidoreductase [Acidobacteriota bacterium]